jgi:hypothetical protein
MSRRVEHQIRSYADALSAQLTPVERLVPDQLEQPAARRSWEDTPDRRGGRSSFAAVAFAVAMVALAAFIPFWLLMNDTDPTTGSSMTPTGTNVFAGTWIGVDETDGSINTLTVDGITLRVEYEESAISACRGAFGETAGGSVVGLGTVDDDRLEFLGTLYCDLPTGPEPVPMFENFTFVITYDPITDTVGLVIDAATRLERATP